MGKLKTLTVQDMLWVHLQLTGVCRKYNYARLEEAVYYQYAYGGSEDVLAQAGRFITGFVKMRPFEGSNEAAAFVGLLGFLEINGKELSLTDEDAEEWVRGVWADPGSAEAKIGVLVNEHEIHLHHGVPDKRGVLTDIFERYSSTLEKLKAGERDLSLI